MKLNFYFVFCPVNELKMIAVLIPCYNEGLTIAKVVKDFRVLLPEAVIYVCDNNSTDNTISEAEQAGAIIMRETKQGKGNVVRKCSAKLMPIVT